VRARPLPEQAPAGGPPRWRKPKPKAAQRFNPRAPHLFWYDRMTLTASYRRSGGMPGPLGGEGRNRGSDGVGRGRARVLEARCGVGGAGRGGEARATANAEGRMAGAVRSGVGSSLATHHLLRVQQRQHHRRLEALAAAVANGPPGEGGSSSVGRRSGGGQAASPLHPPQWPSRLPLDAPGPGRPARRPLPRRPPEPPSPVVPAAERPRALADVAVVLVQGGRRLLRHLGVSYGKTEGAGGKERGGDVCARRSGWQGSRSGGDSGCGGANPCLPLAPTCEASM
jgi:hypothetical protein